MKSPYLLSGSFSYDTILPHDGRFHTRILPESIAKLNVSFGVDASELSFGGTAGNIAYNASLLGQSPTLVACLGGRDADDYLDRLRALGLNPDTLTVVPGKNTAHAYILTDTISNQITGFDKGALSSTPIVPDVTPSLWHLAPDHALTTAMLAGIADRQNKQYFFDPGQALPAFLEGDADGILPLETILVRATGIFVNEYESELLENATRKPLSYWLRPGQFIIKTLGGAGLALISNKGEQHIGAYTPSKMRDPTGCGDALRAGFLYGYTNGWSIEDAAKLGSVMGSFAIEEESGQKHAPSFPDILSRLAMPEKLELFALAEC